MLNFSLRKDNKGFTLIELSIAIIILGLLIAGTIAAMSLVKSSQLYAIINQYNQIAIATRSFKAKYNSMPGDFATASSYFSSCVSIPSGCDGNGNGRLEYRITATYHEGLLAWVHLSDAGFYPGNFLGVGGGLTGMVRMQRFLALMHLQVLLLTHHGLF